jgi:hypothetical protein
MKTIYRLMNIDFGRRGFDKETLIKEMSYGFGEGVELYPETLAVSECKEEILAELGKCTAEYDIINEGYCGYKRKKVYTIRVNAYYVEEVGLDEAGDEESWNVVAVATPINKYPSRDICKHTMYFYS